MAKLTSLGSVLTLNLWSGRKGEKQFLGEKSPYPKVVQNLELMVIQS